MYESALFVVTDIEVDGPRPGRNSMRSFASVAVTPAGEVLGEFDAVLSPLAGAAPDPDTMAWFATQPPGVWAAATTGARPVGEVMGDWVAWVRSLRTPRAFCASPVAFDGTWIDHYLRRFTECGLQQGPYERDTLFTEPALCLTSFMHALGVSQPVPVDWLGGVAHTHRAIDDARGYAHLLGHLYRAVRAPLLGSG